MFPPFRVMRDCIQYVIWYQYETPLEIEKKIVREVALAVNNW